MGNSSSSTEDPVVGYRVLVVNASSPASNAICFPDPSLVGGARTPTAGAFLMFLDIIVSVNGLILDATAAAEDVFATEVRSNLTKPIIMEVYNIKSRRYRTLQVTPSDTWGGEGFLGMQVRWDPLDAVGSDELDAALHIIDVGEGSPAESAGLTAEDDFILGSIDGPLPTPSSLQRYIQSHIGEEVILFILSASRDAVRHISLYVSGAPWGREGETGAGLTVAVGEIHRLPNRDTNGHNELGGGGRVEVGGSGGTRVGAGESGSNFFGGSTASSSHEVFSRSADGNSSSARDAAASGSNITPAATLSTTSSSSSSSAAPATNTASGSAEPAHSNSTPPPPQSVNAPVTVPPSSFSGSYESSSAVSTSTSFPGSSSSATSLMSPAPITGGGAASYMPISYHHGVALPPSLPTSSISSAPYTAPPQILNSAATLDAARGLGPPPAISPFSAAAHQIYAPPSQIPLQAPPVYTHRFSPPPSFPGGTMSAGFPSQPSYPTNTNFGGTSNPFFR